MPIAAYFISNKTTATQAGGLSKIQIFVDKFQ